jgi:hypothetical protein
MNSLMIAITCSALLILGMGCSRHKVTHSHLTGGSGDRQVVADVDGPAWIGPGPDKFTIKITGHEIVIEKERLLLDGKEQGKFPATATKFELVCTNATLTVTADGAEVLATTIGK